MKKRIAFRLTMIWMTFCAAYGPFSGMANAQAPMDFYQTFVAGGVSSGFADGAFDRARFHDPQGLAYDEENESLYVADSGNHRIRVVRLDEMNRVETIAGNDIAGTQDGPVSLATFEYPVLLTLLSPTRLVVYDDKSMAIRMVDLKGGKVSTLTKVGGVSDMVYIPTDDSLYLAEPDNGKVERFDLRSNLLSVVLQNNANMPHPKELAVLHGNLCLADRDLGSILEWVTPASSPIGKGSFSLLGTVSSVLSLAVTGDKLYCIDKTGSLVEVGNPSRQVHFITPWGTPFDNQDHGMSFIQPSFGPKAGFATASADTRKFFIVSNQQIDSVRDLHVENVFDMDFDYPVKKPKNTFRILAIGGSRNCVVYPIPDDPAKHLDEDLVPGGNTMQKTFCKQLEFKLNLEASFQDNKLHYEVLNFSRRGKSLSSWVYEDIPDFVKKYDIDLVIGMTEGSGYQDYYDKPLTSEGIPSRTINQDYLLKPLSQRATTGPASDLLKRCKALKIPVSEKQDSPGDGLWSLFCTGDAQIEKDLIQLTGQRLDMMNAKLKKIRTSSGKAPQFLLYYVPTDLFPNECCVTFWKALGDYYHLPFVDFSDTYNALKVVYYPANAAHYSLYGNRLIAEILFHYLIQNKYVPFSRNVPEGRKGFGDE